MLSQIIRFYLICFSLFLSLTFITAAQDSQKPGFEGIVTQSSEEAVTGVAEENGEQKVQAKKGPSQEEIARSVFVDQLKASSKKAKSTKEHDRILLEGFQQNLKLDFNVTNIIMLARAARQSEIRDQILLEAAQAYAKRFSQFEFLRLAKSTPSKTTREEISKISAANNKEGTSKFYTGFKFFLWDQVQRMGQ
ncbi:hypothetical protein HOF92_06850 [bacterium]|jgi:hypothetical protein|nr:hypothetical protein [bacterium]